MHPPLPLGKHPLCVEVIAALQACHSAHPWAKLVGRCNDEKWALDACFKAEARRTASPRGRVLTCALPPRPTGCAEAVEA